MDAFAIQLDTSQANFFKLCNANFITLNFMAQEGVFAIMGGSATLNFDQKGVLKSIKRELFSYVGDNRSRQ